MKKMQMSGTTIQNDSAKKALVIAISDYEDKELGHLEFCKNDGNEVSKLLKSIGYEIKNEHNLIGRVTKEQIEKAVNTFFTGERIRGKDLLLFYYSGHGIPEDNGDHYIASSEINCRRPWDRGYSFDDLAKMIDRSNSERKVVILDCCYSGSAGLGKGTEDEAVVSGMAAVNNKIKAGYGKCILAASRGSQRSFGREERDYSQFTYYLLEGLKGGDGKSVDENGNVTPEKLSNYVIDKLDNLPDNERPKQRPIRKIEASGDIILAEYPNLRQQAEESKIQKLQELYQKEVEKNAQLSKKLANIQTAKYGWLPDSRYEGGILYETPSEILRNRPLSIDLRPYCPPVYDQGRAGSGAANAIAAALEFDSIKWDKNNAFKPSTLFLYYNARAKRGTANSDSGMQIADGIKSLSEFGACPEALWPNDFTKVTVKPPQECYQTAQKYKAIQYQRIPQNLNQLRGCLATGSPFVFGFTVYPSFESIQVAQTGHVPMPAPSEKLIGGHAGVAVGYEDSQQWFIVRNSWGDKWGMKGYFTLPYTYLLDPDLASDFWTIRVIR